MAENSEVKVVLGGEEVDFPKLLTEEVGLSIFLSSLIARGLVVFVV